jgi:hypothetical protein
MAVHGDQEWRNASQLHRQPSVGALQHGGAIAGKLHELALQLPGVEAHPVRQGLEQKVEKCGSVGSAFDARDADERVLAGPMRAPIQVDRQTALAVCRGYLAKRCRQEACALHQVARGHAQDGVNGVCEVVGSLTGSSASGGSLDAQALSLAPLAPLDSTRGVRTCRDGKQRPG